jgi:uncharacterized protein YjbJ (UPF0337 family)
LLKPENTIVVLLFPGETMAGYTPCQMIGPCRSLNLLLLSRRRRTKTNKQLKVNIMNTLEIKGDWNITKGKLKQKWAKLTDNDLEFAEGKSEELIGRIQKRTGATREAVEEALNESCPTCGCK